MCSSNDSKDFLNYAFPPRFSSVDDREGVVEMDVDTMMSRQNFLDPPNVGERTSNRIHTREGIPRNYKHRSGPESHHHCFRSSFSSKNRSQWEVSSSLSHLSSSNTHLVSPPRLPHCASSRNEYEQNDPNRHHHHQHDHCHSQQYKYHDVPNDADEKRDDQSESMRKIE